MEQLEKIRPVIIRYIVGLELPPGEAGDTQRVILDCGHVFWGDGCKVGEEAICDECNL